jgi:hypothetical protein
MKKIKFVIIFVSLLALSGCASTRLENLEYRITMLEKLQIDYQNELKHKLSNMESGSIKNQENIKNELKKLHQETERQINDLNTKITSKSRTLQDIKTKTDQFNVRRDSRTLFFEPTEFYYAICLTNKTPYKAYFDYRWANEPSWASVVLNPNEKIGRKSEVDQKIFIAFNKNLVGPYQRQEYFLERKHTSNDCESGMKYEFYVNDNKLDVRKQME